MKENMLQTFCFQELQAGMEWIRLVQHGNYCIDKGRPFSVFVDEFLSHVALL